MSESDSAPSSRRGSLLGGLLNILAIVLSCFGLFIALTMSLTQAHSLMVPCGGSSDCAVVADSSYSHLFGLPIAFFGLAGYLAILVLTVWASVSRKALRLALATTAVGVAASAVLIGISAFLIRATCLWCVASAVTMAALFLLSVARTRFQKSAPLSAQCALAVGLLVWASLGATRVSDQAEANLVNHDALRTVSLADLAPDRSPSRGDLQAPVTIIEFADFACPACREFEPGLMKLCEDTAGFRLVFRNLPQPFIAGHEASDYGAVCGEIAKERGLFWQFATQAFLTPKHPEKSDYDRILRGLRIEAHPDLRIADKSDIVMANVNQDLALAHRLGITVTPVFIVLSPDLPPQAATNLNLVDILRRPQILRYLKVRSPR